MKKAIKITIAVVIVVVILVVFAWYGFFRFVFSNERIQITLPFASTDDDVEFMNPMGERVMHFNAPAGHPGIDFGWNHSVELIAPMDGKIKSITYHPPGGYGELTEIYDVKITKGIYATTFQEIVYREGLKSGDKVKKGDLIGYPGSYSNPGRAGTFYSFHWEFDYDSFFYDRLCPMTYFDTDALKRINSMWLRAGETYDGKYTKICSGDYDGRNGYGSHLVVEEAVKR